jgi:acyl carrier protein
VNEIIRTVLREHGRLAVPIEQLSAGDDLFAAGLDSTAVVSVMLALEDRFDIEIPDRLLTRRSFSSLAALEQLVSQSMTLVR